MTSTRPTLAAAQRDVIGKKVAGIRRAGGLPAVVFGHGIASIPVSLDSHEFDQLRHRIGSNALVDLSIDGKKAKPVLVQSVDVHRVTRRPIHANLFVVRMTEELTVDVPVLFVGESLAVTQQGGTLMHDVETVKVRALPDHLPQSFEISIETLTDFEGRLHVRDLTIPTGVTVLNDLDESIAHILPPRVEEAAPEAAPVVAEDIAGGEVAPSTGEAAPEA